VKRLALVVQIQFCVSDGDEAQRVLVTRFGKRSFTVSSYGLVLNFGAFPVLS
jgi:hypothetical protein